MFNKNGRYYYFYGVFREAYIAVVYYVLYYIIAQRGTQALRKSPLN